MTNKLKAILILTTLTLSGCITNEAEIKASLERCETSFKTKCVFVAIPENRFDRLQAIVGDKE